MRSLFTNSLTTLTCKPDLKIIATDAFNHAVDNGHAFKKHKFLNTTAHLIANRTWSSLLSDMHESISVNCLYQSNHRDLSEYEVIILDYLRQHGLLIANADNRDEFHTDPDQYAIFHHSNDHKQAIDNALDVYRYSPSGLGFGYGGSGPKQAALALMCHLFGLNTKQHPLDYMVVFREWTAYVSSTTPYAFSIEEFLLDLYTLQQSQKGKDTTGLFVHLFKQTIDAGEFMAITASLLYEYDLWEDDLYCQAITDTFAAKFNGDLFLTNDALYDAMKLRGISRWVGSYDDPDIHQHWIARLNQTPLSKMGGNHEENTIFAVFPRDWDELAADNNEDEEDKQYNG